MYSALLHYSLRKRKPTTFMLIIKIIIFMEFVRGTHAFNSLLIIINLKAIIYYLDEVARKHDVGFINQKALTWYIHIYFLIFGKQW